MQRPALVSYTTLGTPTIVAKEADYVLALKGNQGTLRDDVELFFAEQKARKFNDTAISTSRYTLSTPSAAGNTSGA